MGADLVAREMASRNITCNAVAPGFVPTDLTSALLKQMEETILKQIPLARFGTVEDVANAIAFLVSDEASYITGQVIVVDGGLFCTTLRPPRGWTPPPGYVENLTG